MPFSYISIYLLILSRLLCLIKCHDYITKRLRVVHLYNSERTYEMAKTVLYIEIVERESKTENMKK